MSVTIATLPRSGGNGAALVMVVADLVMGLYAKATAKAAPKAVVAAQAVSLPTAGKVDVWQLYRLGVNSDSVNPKVLATLQNQLAD